MPNNLNGNSTTRSRLATSEGELGAGFPFAGTVYRDGHEVARFTPDRPGTLNMLVQQRIHGALEICITDEAGESVRIPIHIGRRAASVNGPDALAERVRAKREITDALREETEASRRARDEAQHEAALWRRDYDQAIRHLESERASSRWLESEVERLTEKLRAVTAERERGKREFHEERRRWTRKEDELRGTIRELEQKLSREEYRRQAEEIERQALKRQNQQQERTISELRREVKTLRDSARAEAKESASRKDAADHDTKGQQWLFVVLAYVAGLYSPKVLPVLLNHLQPEQKDAESEETLEDRDDGGAGESLLNHPEAYPPPPSSPTFNPLRLDNYPQST